MDEARICKCGVQQLAWQSRVQLYLTAATASKAIESNISNAAIA